jgi:hypothetical protein
LYAIFAWDYIKIMDKMRTYRSKVLSILIFVFLGLSPILSLGQKATNSKPKKFTDKLFVGGALGLTLGDITQIDVNPIGGIWIIPQWSVGIGGRYSYYSHRGYFIGGSSQPYRSHIWGGSVFTQILPIRDFSETFPVIPFKGGILFHAEYEKLSVDRKMVNPLGVDQTGKTWVELYLVGFGYRQRLGERAAINFMLLWDVSNSNYSPYQQNPMLRVNFTI